MTFFAGAFGSPISPESAVYEQLLAVFSERSTELVSITHWHDGALFSSLDLLNQDQKERNLNLSKDGLAVSFNGFLTNRPTLANKLELSQFRCCDSEIVARAYRTWGRDVLAHLEGRFAFTLWDELAQAGFCARDHFGQLPLYYSIQEEHVFVGSDVRVLLRNPAIETKLNEQSVRRYLAGLPPSMGETFFQEIKSLPAGNFLVWNRGETRIGQYWATPKDIPYTELPFSQQVSQFRDLFDNAIVQAFSRSKAPVFFLSGGLDSSSIVANARRLFDVENLQAVSMILSEDQRMNEQKDQHAVAAMGGIEVLEVDGSKVDYLGSLNQILFEQSGPTLAAGMGLSIHSYSAAARLGADCVFTGHGGDETISFGHGRLFELRRDKQWGAFFYELFRADPSSSFRHFYELLTRRPPLSYLRKATSFAFPARKTHPFERNGSNFLLQQHEIDLNTESGSVSDVLHPDRIEQTSHIATVADPLQAYAFETLNNMANGRNFQVHYPMWDRHLVEFCLSLPPESKRKHGYDRFILREAMRGTLVESVRTKRTKCDFGITALASLRRDSNELVDSLFQDQLSQYSDLIDLKKSSYVYSRFKEADPSESSGFLTQSIWKLMSLTKWMEDPLSKAYKPEANQAQPRVFQSFIKRQS